MKQGVTIRALITPPYIIIYTKAGQQILLLLGNHYRVPKIPPLQPPLIQINSVHNFHPHLLNIYLNTILISVSSFPKLSLLFRFSTKMFNTFLISHLSHPPSSNQHNIFCKVLDYVIFSVLLLLPLPQQFACRFT
jgi:hypothetical protein